jgi:hypothetical protein
MRTESAGSPVVEPQQIPRLKRSTAAVVAQYIQDITRPPRMAPCPPAA